MIKYNHDHDFECSECVGHSGICRGEPWAFEMICMINGDKWVSFIKKPPDFEGFSKHE